MHLLPLLLLSLLAGCGTLHTINYEKLTPEQLTAMAKDRSMLVDCTIVSGVAGWGGGKTIHVQNDKGVAAETAITSDANCNLTITTAPKPTVPPK